MPVILPHATPRGVVNRNGNLRTNPAMKFERPDRPCFRGPWPKAGIGIHAHDTDWMEQITSIRDSNLLKKIKEPKNSNIDIKQRSYLHVSNMCFNIRLCHPSKKRASR